MVIVVTYLILCRSLTYAQQTARVLERSGIGAKILRTPRSIAGDGCGYCVKISDRQLSAALPILHREGLGPKQIYIQTGENQFSEVTK